MKCAATNQKARSIQFGDNDLWHFTFPSFCMLTLCNYRFSLDS